MMYDILENLDYVYVISDGRGFVKVGISKNPDRRLHQLQTSNANKLKIEYVEEFTCTRKHLLKIETLIHRELCRITKHMKGEWFKINDDQLEDVINVVIFHRMRYNSDKYAFI